MQRLKKLVTAYEVGSLGWPHWVVGLSRAAVVRADGLWPGAVAFRRNRISRARRGPSLNRHGDKKGQRLYPSRRAAGCLEQAKSNARLLMAALGFLLLAALIITALAGLALPFIIVVT